MQGGAATSTSADVGCVTPELGLEVAHTQSRVPESKQKGGEYVTRRGSSMREARASSHLEGGEVDRGR